jgi:hypothetical protein
LGGGEEEEFAEKETESSMQSSKPIMLLHTSAPSPVTLDITERQRVRGSTEGGIQSEHTSKIERQ